MKKYQVIYADPPWSYTDQCHSGKRGAIFKYPVMTDEQIQALPVRYMTDQTCALFLWATFPKLPEALDTFRAWGFRYRGLAFSWTKTYPKKGTLVMGMGHYTRSNAEVCLLGIKGRPRRVSASVRSAVIAPREVHSKKPDVIRDSILELMGNVPRIELFARQHTPGWDVFGNQGQGSIDITRYLPYKPIRIALPSQATKDTVAQKLKEALAGAC